MTDNRPSTNQYKTTDDPSNQTATGSYIAQASGGSTAFVNVNVPRP